MTEKEFWNKIKESYEKLKDSDKVGIAFFIQDLEILINEWEKSEADKRGFAP